MPDIRGLASYNGNLRRKWATLVAWQLHTKQQSLVTSSSKTPSKSPDLCSRCRPIMQSSTPDKVQRWRSHRSIWDIKQLPGSGRHLIICDAKQLKTHHLTYGTNMPDDLLTRHCVMTRCLQLPYWQGVKPLDILNLNYLLNFRVVALLKVLWLLVETKIYNWFSIPLIVKDIWTAKVQTSVLLLLWVLVFFFNLRLFLFCFVYFPFYGSLRIPAK